MHLLTRHNMVGPYKCLQIAGGRRRISIFLVPSHLHPRFSEIIITYYVFCSSRSYPFSFFSTTTMRCTCWWKKNALKDLNMAAWRFNFVGAGGIIFVFGYNVLRVGKYNPKIISYKFETNTCKYEFNFFVRPYQFAKHACTLVNHSARPLMQACIWLCQVFCMCCKCTY